MADDSRLAVWATQAMARRAQVLERYLEEKYHVVVSSGAAQRFSTAIVQAVTTLAGWDTVLPKEVSRRAWEDVGGDLSQALVLGYLGLKVPTAMLLRRALVNVYLGCGNQPSLGGQESVPFRDLMGSVVLTSVGDVGDVDPHLANRLIETIQYFSGYVYDSLSAYVEDARGFDPDPAKFLASLKVSEAEMGGLAQLAGAISSVMNALLIVRFGAAYRRLTASQRSVVRLALAANPNIARQVQECLVSEN